MPRATYMLELELSYNTWADVTQDWYTALPLVIERGIEPGERMAGVGRMTLALYNPDGCYTPSHSGVTSGFEAGIGVRLRASDGESTYTLFYGRLAAIDPRREVGSGGRKAPHLYSEIVCEDDMTAPGRIRLGIFPLMLDVEPRDLINPLVDASFTPPGLFDYWRLGHPDAGKLGQTTALPGDYTGQDFDAGQSVFPWAGDTWLAELPIYQAMLDVCNNEGGYFYLAADGTPVFDDRHARPKATTPAATLDGSLAGVSVERGLWRVVNRVEITVYPREIGDPGEVLWAAQKVIKVMPSKPLTLLCRYVDPAQEAIAVGALDPIPLVPYVDYTANNSPSGLGMDRTEKLRVEEEFGASAVYLTLISLRRQEVPLFVFGLQVRGTPLRTYQPAAVVLEDETSRLDYGLRPLYLDLPLQDDTAVAEDMANALLINRKDPYPWLAVTVEATVSAGLLMQALARDVGDRLAVSDDDLALDEAGCFIDGIRHVIERGGASHRVTWRTSPADLNAYWVLGVAGYAELGESARLGY